MICLILLKRLTYLCFLGEKNYSNFNIILTQMHKFNTYLADIDRLMSSEMEREDEIQINGR